MPVLPPRRASGSESVPSRWAAPYVIPRRSGIVATTGPAATAAFGIYRPHRKHSIVANRLSRALFHLGVARASPPPTLPIESVLARAGLRADGLVVMRSHQRGRTVVGVECAGQLRYVAKIGPVYDDLLRHEADLLARRVTTGRSYAVARVHWSGEAEGCFALIYHACPASSWQPVTAEQALPVAIELAAPAGDRPAIVHGDFAPWNLLPTPGRPTLIDWEHARVASQPLFDLAHYVTQEGVFLRRHSPARAVELLTGPGGLGVRLLRALGPEPGAAPDLVRAYLRQTLPSAGWREARYRTAMWDLLR